jgi:hypothetical protein
MVDAVSGSDPTAILDGTYGAIVVVGGGCYGSYYVRQLGRARQAGALRWDRVIVVDRDPSCRIAQSLAAGDVATPAVQVAIAEWADFFRTYLDAACADPAATARDAIVPSPLMPHLMYEWLLARTGERWPARTVATRPLAGTPAVPWHRTAPTGTSYVSFAEWVCPVNCIEPTTCPKTRETRWWTMPAALEAYADGERAAGRPLAGPVIFHCTHRADGVGMFDTAAAVRADAIVRDAGTRGPADVLIGTVSHCHGALNVLAIGEGRGNDC